MPQPNESLAQIEQHRAQIDAIDKQIVALLNERAGHSLDIRALKPDANMGLFDPKREEEIFAKICSYNEGPLYNENLKEIYGALLKVMKEVPNRD
jgi:chorismate mutase